MRILFIHQNFPGQFKHLAPELASKGHTVVAICINKPQSPTPGVKIIQHRPKTHAADPATPYPELGELQAKMARGHSVANVLTRLKKEGFTPDLIYVHTGWGESLFIKDVFPDVPLLVYAEYYYGGEGGDANFDPEFSRWTQESAMRLKIKNTHLLHGLMDADHAITPTQFQKSQHPKLLHKKISVIHDGIDTARFAPDPQAFVSLKRAGLTLRSENEVITFVARELEPYRGYHIFMRALPHILAERPKAQVIIVGGDGVSYGAAPPKNSTWKDVFLQEVSSRLDLKRVHFVGKVPHEVLTQLMQISAVHVYLSYPFVLSWSMLEAMSIGCLIVGSRTAPVEEVIQHGKNGLLTDFFDPEQLAKTVTRALEKRKDMQPLRDAARRHVVNHCDLRTRCLPAQMKKINDLVK